MTQRLMLRPFTAADQAAVHQYAADPEVTRYTGWGPLAGRHSGIHRERGRPSARHLLFAFDVG